MYATQDFVAIERELDEKRNVYEELIEKRSVHPSLKIMVGLICST